MNTEDWQLRVNKVSKTFIMPHEKHTSLKQAALNLHRRKFEKFHVLKDIDFEVKRGEFFGVVGRNGSGKSTLLKILASIYQPTTGSVEVKGRLTPFIELGVGFNMELSGRDNVFLNGAILGLTTRELQQKYEEIVEFAELEKFMDQKLKNYSSGMLVRLAFSIAIQAHTDVLLVDEVLAVGDANFQRKCFDVFEDVKKQGKTVVFVTHDMAAVQRFCDRGLVLQSGEVKLIGAPVEIANAYQEINLRDAAEERKKIPKQDRDIDIDIKIVKYDKQAQKLRLRLSYKNKQRRVVYAGFSVVKDGATVAELNSLGKESDRPSGQLEYELDTSKLNPGFYQLAAGLIDAEKKELLLATDEWAEFNVLGFDPNRGGAMRLPDNWELK